MLELGSTNELETDASGTRPRLFILTKSILIFIK